MNSEPLVTVNILSYNRKNELHNTLTKVFEQDYKNIEVIVVDNDSTDGAPEMVEQKFPLVKLIKLSKNIGIVGWNKGFEKAEGEYVLVLDDDSYPSKNALRMAIHSVKCDTVAVYALAVYNYNRKIFESENFHSPTNQFVGCGAIIRRRIFIELGGFDDSILVYCHEFDFAIRVIDAGYQIEFVEDAIVYHQNYDERMQYSSINNSFYFYFSTINNFVLTFKYLPYKHAVIVSAKYLINRILISFYYHYFFTLLKAMVNFIKMLLFNKIKRQYVTKQTLIFFNYRLVPIFDREYFGNLVNYNHKYRIKILQKYITTFFRPMKEKNKFVR